MGVWRHLAVRSLRLLYGIRNRLRIEVRMRGRFQAVQIYVRRELWDVKLI